MIKVSIFHFSFIFSHFLRDQTVQSGEQKERKKTEIWKLPGGLSEETKIWEKWQGIPRNLWSFWEQKCPLNPVHF